ncbi:MAG: hypothetical protein R2795_04165 [Saprospiraceae bacterium]
MDSVWVSGLQAAVANGTARHPHCNRTSVLLDGTLSTPSGLLNFYWGQPAQLTADWGIAQSTQPANIRLIVERRDNGCRDTVFTQVVQNTTPPVTIGCGYRVELLSSLPCFWERGCQKTERRLLTSGGQMGCAIPNNSDTLGTDLPGIYVVRIRLQNGCYSRDTVMITEDILLMEFSRCWNAKPEP